MTTLAQQQQTRILVQAAAEACEDKKGQDTRILELDPIDSGLSDFFLVTSATNDRQSVAIADEIEDKLKKEFGVLPNSVEGRRKGEWILLDYVDFVVHVFLAERRAFYDIERLRKSARPLTPAEFDAELKAALAEKTAPRARKPPPSRPRRARAPPPPKKPQPKRRQPPRKPPRRKPGRRAPPNPFRRRKPHLWQRKPPRRRPWPNAAPQRNPRLPKSAGKAAKKRAKR